MLVLWRKFLLQYCNREKQILSFFCFEITLKIILTSPAAARSRYLASRLTVQGSVCISVLLHKFWNCLKYLSKNVYWLFYYKNTKQSQKQLLLDHFSIYQKISQIAVYFCSCVNLALIEVGIFSSQLLKM